ncbi:hypothetical protein J6590_009268 [Homalodisca vitripennis]|nr:hypothetical protein J6590_009268 [Homalodisca vitripennis]
MGGRVDLVEMLRSAPHLKSDAVAELTPEIWRTEGIQKYSATKNEQANTEFYIGSSSETPRCHHNLGDEGPPDGLDARDCSKS